MLPLLVLQRPLILLPASRFTVPVAANIAESLLALTAASETLPVVAAVPLVGPGANSTVNLAEWGTAARVLKIVKPPARNPRQPYLVSLHGLSRVRLLHGVHENTLVLEDLASLPKHDVEYAPTERVATRTTIDAFKRAALQILDRLAHDAVQQSRKEGYTKIANMIDDITDARAPWMADVLVGSISGDYDDKFALLNTPDPEARLQLATSIFVKQASISEVSKKIASAVDESVSKQQKEFFLRQQLAAIQRELATLQGNPSSSDSGSSSSSELDDDDQSEQDDLADLKRKIEAMAPGSEERKMGVREFRRLKRIPAGSVENGVIRSYIEWLTSIPWTASAAPSPLTDKNFLQTARAQLDADHYGLEKIKKRLIEYLAVVRLKQLNSDSDSAGAQLQLAVEGEQSTPAPAAVPAKRKPVKGPILLFVGPPGTGKTSLGQSIAKALGRPFQRIALGGVRDEAEIRGHRRTYVASGPGLIVQALRKAGRPDPVLLLDEIDKVGQSNFHGDPGAALLEVLDPEQNHTFNDHYLNVPVDLSQVLFICTANSLDTISPPLLDRCEVVPLSGYTPTEKLHIARRFLLPRQLEANGLKEGQIEIDDDALLGVVRGYTREAGVRSLERAVGGVARFKAVEWAEISESQTESQPESSEVRVYDPRVREEDLEKILGISRADLEEKERELRRGVVWGLVVMGQGEGGVMPIETVALPGKGALKLTGSLGDVIKESADLALTWVKTHAYELSLTPGRNTDPLLVPSGVDVHLHMPAGATKKDGPSAGVAMVCALVSLLTGHLVPPTTAMTGEITLRGRVTPVGGIKEKVLGAHRAGMTKVILPIGNRKDAEMDIPKEVKGEIEIVFVRTVREGIKAAFGDAVKWRGLPEELETRL